MTRPLPHGKTYKLTPKSLACHTTQVSANKYLRKLVCLQRNGNQIDIYAEERRVYRYLFDLLKQANNNLTPEERRTDDNWYRITRGQHPVCDRWRADMSAFEHHVGPAPSDTSWLCLHNPDEPYSKHNAYWGWR